MVDKKKSKLKNLFDEEDEKKNKTQPTKPDFSKSTELYKTGYYNSTNQYNGLKNFGNTCYSNVVIQSIVACNNIFQCLDKYIKILETLEQKIIDSEYPTLFNLYYAMGFYLQKNSTLSAQHLKVLSSIFDPFSKQNDAHEFLVFVLSKTHEECIKLQELNKENKDFINSIEKETLFDLVKDENDKFILDNNKKKNNNTKDNDDNNWEEIKKDGKRMKLTNSENDFPLSSISKYFGGIIKHETHKSGISVSNSKIEPFYVLSLDSQLIEIPKCIDAYFKKRLIDNNDEYYQKTYLEKPPNILILQVKSFYYDKIQRKVVKDKRAITYSFDLKINEEWLSPSQKN